MMVILTLHFKHTIYSKTKTISNVIRNKQFTDLLVKLNVGDTLKFENDDILRHSLQINDNSIPNSPLLLPGDVFEVKFLKKGEYVFFSSLYKYMFSCRVFVA